MNIEKGGVVHRPKEWGFSTGNDKLRIKCSSGVLKDSSILENETNLF